MKQNKFVGKKCIVYRIHGKCESKFTFDPAENRPTLKILSGVKELEGLILGVQRDTAIIALKDIREKCTFEDAKKIPTDGAYIPKAWEILKYIKYLQKYWSAKGIYWTSQISYQGSDDSSLYRLYLDSDYCYVCNFRVDGDGHLFAGYFVKEPISQIKIIE